MSANQTAPGAPYTPHTPDTPRTVGFGTNGNMIVTARTSLDDVFRSLAHDIQDGIQARPCTPVTPVPRGGDTVGLVTSMNALSVTPLGRYDMM